MGGFPACFCMSLCRAGPHMGPHVSRPFHRLFRIGHSVVCPWMCHSVFMLGPGYCQQSFAICSGCFCEGCLAVCAALRLYDSKRRDMLPTRQGGAIFLLEWPPRY